MKLFTPSRGELNTAPRAARPCAHSGDIDRIRKAARLKQKVKFQRKQIVLNSHYRIADITRDTKPFTAARIVHDMLQSRTHNPPSIRTTMRYLREEKLVGNVNSDKRSV